MNNEYALRVLGESGDGFGCAVCGGEGRGPEAGLLEDRRLECKVRT